jgi:hypothetical protein
MINKIKENSTVIMIVIMVLLLLKQCSVSREISKTSKEVKELRALTDSLSHETASKEEIRQELRRSLFDFLIYETDLDDKKTSLSEIRRKVDEK